MEIIYYIRKSFAFEHKITPIGLFLFNCYKQKNIYKRVFDI